LRGECRVVECAAVMTDVESRPYNDAGEGGEFMRMSAAKWAVLACGLVAVLAVSLYFLNRPSPKPPNGQPDIRFYGIRFASDALVEASFCRQ
jgi:hypothetical protein